MFFPEGNWAFLRNEGHGWVKGGVSSPSLHHLSGSAITGGPKRGWEGGWDLRVTPPGCASGRAGFSLRETQDRTAPPN